jgi:hypothetical protein
VPAVNQSPRARGRERERERDGGANERATEIARWAGLNGGSARVLNTSYLADR